MPEQTMAAGRKAVQPFPTVCALLLAVLIPAFGHARDVNKDMIKAAKKGNTAKLQAALAKGADVNFKAKDTQTALIMASERSHAETVRVLLAHGADVNAKDENGLTPLMAAAWGAKETQGQAELLDIRGPNHSTVFPPAEPRARQAQSDIVEALLRQGAEVGARAQNGRSALALAAYRGSTETVKALLAAGADVNVRRNDGRTPLIEATVHCYTDTAEILLANGADVNAASSGGITALMEAAAHSCTDTVEVLLAKGAEVNAATDNGLTALMYASYSPYKGDIEVVKNLIAQGADVNAETSDGRTAVTFAKSWKDVSPPRASSSPPGAPTSRLGAQMRIRANLRALGEVIALSRLEKHKKKLAQILEEAGAKE